MAHEVLVSNQLTQDMIDAGKELIEKLDNAASQITAALWLYLPQNQIWKLLFVSPLVSAEGPNKFYQRVIEANKLAKPSEHLLPLSAIGLTDENSELVQKLKIAIKTGPKIYTLRISKTTVNGLYVEDAHIYRLT